MSDLELVAVGVVVALLGGAAGFWTARREWAIRREITGADNVRARSLVPGVVELTGDAVPAEETFTAPLTGRECLAYQYSVEELRRKRSHGNDGGSRTVWRELRNEERAAPFYVDDGTGRAMVDAPVARFELERSHGVESDGDDLRPTGRLRSLRPGGGSEEDLPITEEVRQEVAESRRKRRYEERLKWAAIGLAAVVLGGLAVAGGLGLLPFGDASGATAGAGLLALHRRRVVAPDYGSISSSRRPRTARIEPTSPPIRTS